MGKQASDEIVQKTVNTYYTLRSDRKTAEALSIPRTTVQLHLRYAEERGIKPRIKVKSNNSAPAEHKVTKVVWFTDAHNQPGLSLDRFHWLADLVNEEQPDYLIDGGDFDDLNSLCKHEGNETYAGKFKPAFMDDLAASQQARDLLDTEITHPCEKHFILGNHEDRLFSFENRNPEVYGMMQHAYMEIHKNWKITPYRQYLDIEGVDFTHIPMDGRNQPVGAKRPCISIAASSIKDICFGHTHTNGYHEEAKYGPSRSVIAINGGCFMPEGYIPKYATGSSKRYWYGAHVIEISNGRIISHKPITMRELATRYK